MASELPPGFELIPAPNAPGAPTGASMPSWLQNLGPEHQSEPAAAPAASSALPPGFELIQPDKPKSNLAAGVIGAATDVPVLGPIASHLNAAVQAGIEPFTGGEGVSHKPTFNERRQENLDIEAKRLGKFQEEHPVTSTVANLAGTAGLAAPLMAVPAGAAALGAGGKSILGSMGRMGASGAAISGVDALERGHDPLAAAGTGALIGAALPPVFAGGKAALGRVTGATAAREAATAAETEAAARRAIMPDEAPAPQPQPSAPPAAPAPVVAPAPVPTEAKPAPVAPEALPPEPPAPVAPAVAAPPPVEFPEFKPSRGAQPLTMGQFIRRNGGLELTPDVHSADLHEPLVPGKIGPVAHENGLSIDGFWRERLMEEGYLPRDADGYMSRDVRNEIIDALQQEAAGRPRYSAQDQHRIGQNAPKMDEYGQQIEKHANDIVKAAEKVGLRRADIETPDLYNAAEMVYRGEVSDPVDALERAMSERVSHHETLGEIPATGAAPESAGPLGAASRPQAPPVEPHGNGASAGEAAQPPRVEPAQVPVEAPVQTAAAPPSAPSAPPVARETLPAAPEANVPLVRGSSLTTGAVKQAAQNGYRAIDTAGTRLSSDAIDSLIGNVEKQLELHNFSPEYQKDVYRVLSTMRGRENHTFGGLMQDMQYLTSLQADPTKVNSVAAGVAKRGIVNFLNNVKQGDVIAGNPQRALEMLQEHNKNWRIFKTAERLEKALRNGEFNAMTSGTGHSNTTNAIMQAFKPVLKAIEDGKLNVPPDVKKAVSAVVMGKTYGLRHLSKFAPTGVVPLGMEAVVGGVAGLPAAIGLGVAGLAAKKATEAIVRARARRAIEAALSHAPVSQRFQQIRQFGGLNPSLGGVQAPLQLPTQ